MAGARFYVETDLLNFEALNKLADNLHRLVQGKATFSKAEIISLEKERRRLRHRFVQLARALEGKFVLIKRALAKSHVGCDPFAPVIEAEDKSGVCLMNGDQLLQRCRNLQSIIGLPHDTVDHLRRAKREFRRLARRFNVLVKKSLFSSKDLKHSVRDCLLDISEKLARAGL
jgi:uncharacterized protein YdcH (DUF465 family)